jgi:hypothetical protein
MPKVKVSITSLSLRDQRQLYLHNATKVLFEKIETKPKTRARGVRFSLNQKSVNCFSRVVFSSDYSQVSSPEILTTTSQSFL